LDSCPPEGGADVGLNVALYATIRTNNDAAVRNAFDTQSTTRAGARTHARVAFIECGSPARCRRAQRADHHTRYWQHHLLGDWQTYPLSIRSKDELHLNQSSTPASSMTCRRNLTKETSYESQ
jgi:hypothetical protein